MEFIEKHTLCRSNICFLRNYRPSLHDCFPANNRRRQSNKDSGNRLAGFLNRLWTARFFARAFLGLSSLTEVCQCPTGSKRGLYPDWRGVPSPRRTQRTPLNSCGPGYLLRVIGAFSFAKNLKINISAAALEIASLGRNISKLALVLANNYNHHMKKIYLYAITDYDYLKDITGNSNCPNARSIASRHISLTTSTFLTQGELRSIIERIKKI